MPSLFLTRTEFRNHLTRHVLNAVDKGELTVVVTHYGFPVAKLVALGEADGNLKNMEPEDAEAVKFGNDMFELSGTRLLPKKRQQEVNRREAVCNEATKLRMILETETVPKKVAELFNSLAKIIRLTKDEKERYHAVLEKVIAPQHLTTGKTRLEPPPTTAPDEESLGVAEGI